MPVPDRVYRRVRAHAVARGTSVSVLVREFLESLADGEPDLERRRRLQDEVMAAVRRFRAAGRLKRDEAHDRDALR